MFDLNPLTLQYDPMPDREMNIMLYKINMQNIMENGLTSRKLMLLERYKTLYRARTKDASCLTKKELEELTDLVESHDHDESSALKDASKQLNSDFTIDKATRQVLLTNMEAVNRSFGLVTPDYMQTPDMESNVATYQNEAKELVTLIKTSHKTSPLQVIGQANWILHRALYRAGNKDTKNSCLLEDEMENFVELEELFGTAQQVQELKSVLTEMKKNGFSYNQETAKNLKTKLFFLNEKIGLAAEIDQYEVFHPVDKVGLEDDSFELTKQPFESWVKRVCESAPELNATTTPDDNSNPYAIKIESFHHDFRSDR